MIRPFENDADLIDRKRRLLALAETSVERAKAAGWHLAQGAWLQPVEEIDEDEIDDIVESAPSDPPLLGTVCLVGAIGVVRRAETDDEYFAGPEDVAPLIKNGDRDLVDDSILWLLSDGFEQYGVDPNTTHAMAMAANDRLMLNYMAFAYSVGEYLSGGDERPEPTDLETPAWFAKRAVNEYNDMISGTPP